VGDPSLHAFRGEDIVGAIGPGLLVYVGVATGDGPAEVAWLARKIAELRLFPADVSEDARSMERSLADTGGAVLLVSQFTLLADTRRGRRPAFTAAASPEVATPLIDAIANALVARGIAVAQGRFGAHMRVESENDGPVTILLDSHA
jgi:D-tyrosyl-tRNA(Tyr) deacylase